MREYAAPQKPQNMPEYRTKPINKPIPNSTLLSMTSTDATRNGSDSSLNQRMQQRLSEHFFEKQIPSAEAEADRLAATVQGAQTPAQVSDALGSNLHADFSSVRFHTDSNAVQQAEAMGARAYTTGKDIYFGEGGFDPAVAAHELVHTVQQGAIAGDSVGASVPMGTVQLLPKDKPAGQQPVTASTSSTSATDTQEDASAFRVPVRETQRFEPPQPQEGVTYREKAYADQEIQDAKGQKRTVSSLQKALSPDALGGLSQEPALSTTLQNLKSLVSSGKDYNSTREGRQYLLGVYSAAERAISQYITDFMQGKAAAGESDHFFRLDHMETYQSYMNLLASIRQEHQNTVQAVAEVTRKDPASDELPVYEGDLKQDSPEKTAAVRAGALRSWQSIAKGDGPVTIAKTAAQDSPQQERDADQQFEGEALSYMAKMLETSTGRQLLDVATNSSHKLTVQRGSKPAAGTSDSADNNAVGYEAVSDDAEGNYLPCQAEMSNVQEILQAASRNRRTEENPDGYDGIIFGDKKYKFGTGAKGILDMPVGMDPTTASGDVGENNVFAQTSPWVIFAHEMGHAAKNLTGTKGSVSTRGEDGKLKSASFPQEMFSADRLRDFSGNTEEVANWYLEDALRREGQIGKKVAYNPYTAYSKWIYSEDTGRTALTYIKDMHSQYQSIQQYGLQNDPRFAPFVQEFQQKAQAIPDLFSPERSLYPEEKPQAKVIPGASNQRGPGDPLSVKEGAVGEYMQGRNAYQFTQSKQHRFASVDSFTPTPADADAVISPEQHYTDFVSTVKSAAAEKKAALEGTFQQLNLSKLSPFGFFGSRKRAYAKDQEFQGLKAMLEQYNQGDKGKSYNLNDLSYMIGQIDQYNQKFADLEAAGQKKGIHKGRRKALAQLRGQLQSRIDSLRSPSPSGT